MYTVEHEQQERADIAHLKSLAQLAGVTFTEYLAYRKHVAQESANLVDDKTTDSTNGLSHKVG